jgi:hypothetical protein
MDFFGNKRPDTGNLNAFDVGAIESKTAAPAAPTLTSISPNQGIQGLTYTNVVLTGTNFIGVSSINVSGTRVTVSSFTTNSTTQITATFVIAGNANSGARNVTVTAAGGTTTDTVTFTIVQPRLTSIAPIQGTRGNRVPVTITGSGLTGTTAVTVSGLNITATNVVVVSDTQVTATLNILDNASTTGTRQISTTNSGGANSANSVSFTVVSAATPTLTSISPTSGTHNTTVPVTLTGTNFTPISTINVSGTGITVSNVNVVSSTQITANFVITNFALRTTRNVSVTTGGGTTANRTFTVN